MIVRRGWLSSRNRAINVLLGIRALFQRLALDIDIERWGGYFGCSEKSLVILRNDFESYCSQYSMPLPKRIAKHRALTGRTPELVLTINPQASIQQERFRGFCFHGTCAQTRLLCNGPRVLVFFR